MLDDMTVSLQLAVLSPAFAVMVAVPSALAVTSPLLETVATAVFDEVHVTVLSVALAGETVAVIVAVCPTSNDSASMSRLIPETLMELPLPYTGRIERP